MLESWRSLNPRSPARSSSWPPTGSRWRPWAASTPGANRMHLSDGCGGTGAAKRSDQKHAGVPVPAVLPTVHDVLVEEGVRERVEISVDGGVQTGEQALKLALLGADRIGFGTSAAGRARLLDAAPVPPRRPAPGDADRRAPAGLQRRRRHPGPALVARFARPGAPVASYLLWWRAEMRRHGGPRPADAAPPT